MGSQEGDDAAEAKENLRRLWDMAAALQSRGWGQSGNLEVYEIPGAGHNEAAWAARVAFVLSYLFPPGTAAR